MKKYNEFIVEKKKLEQLKYYLFDWDDNILKMHTMLHFWRKEGDELIPFDITPEEFADMRKKYPTDYMDNDEYHADFRETFIEFRDFGPRGDKAFLEDVITSIKMGKDTMHYFIILIF